MSIQYSSDTQLFMNESSRYIYSTVQSSNKSSSNFSVLSHQNATKQKQINYLNLTLFTGLWSDLYPPLPLCLPPSRPAPFFLRFCLLSLLFIIFCSCYCSCSSTQFIFICHTTRFPHTKPNSILFFSFSAFIKLIKKWMSQFQPFFFYDWDFDWFGASDCAIHIIV